MQNSMANALQNVEDGEYDVANARASQASTTFVYSLLDDAIMHITKTGNSITIKGDKGVRPWSASLNRGTLETYIIVKAY